MEWLLRVLRGRTFARGLSLGCGTGALERDLISRGICEAIDALDISFVSVAEARRSASGLPIRYIVADFDRAALPNHRYDIVLFHQSLHHVTHLEALLDSILRCLKPGGLLYADEYIGPSRDEWTEQVIEPHRNIYNLLPAEMRLWERLPLPIEVDDPSEAVRSSQILDALKVGFIMLHFRPYGGNLLSVLYPAMNAKRIDEETMRLLIIAERKHLALGEAPYHAVMVLEPKEGAARLFARGMYRLQALRRPSR